MFQLFFFISLLALLLYLLLPRYLLSIYRRYRGDPYWSEVRPYRKRYSANSVVLLFVLLGLQLIYYDGLQWFYLWFMACLLSLSWLDLKLRILPDELLLALAVGGLLYTYFVMDGHILLRLATVLLWAVCAKIVLLLAVTLRDNQADWGFGAGDVKLILALLCWFDTQLMLHLLAIACCMALWSILAVRLWLKKSVSSVAFGPYLSFAAYIIWWYG
ncbi:MAG: prepilin peptidase [Alcaligenaceae bacterium]|nr:prepilin peptidase [Alcaligenaceae bacterium]